MNMVAFAYNKVSGTLNFSEGISSGKENVKLRKVLAIKPCSRVKSWLALCNAWAPMKKSAKIRCRRPPAFL